MSSTFYLLKDYQKALSILELAYNKNMLNSEKEILNLARLYIYLNNPIKAASLVDKEFASGRLKQNEDNLLLLANAYLQAQEINQSAQTYLRLAKLSNNSNFYLQAARLFMEAKQWNKVIITLDKTDNKLDKGQVYLMKGMALLELNELDKATLAFREAKQQADTRVRANQWLDFLNTKQQTH